MKINILSLFAIAIISFLVVAGFADFEANEPTLEGILISSASSSVRRLPSLPAAPGHNGRSFNAIGRLIVDEEKMRIDCPRRSESLAVIVVAGQSNASNSAQGMFSTKYPWNVVNFHDGECYAAASPLLGAENEKGEFITPMADALVSSGSFSDVIILSLGVGGSLVSDWAKGGRLHLEATNRIEALAQQYPITSVIWHQGEADFQAGTSAEDYKRAFRSFERSISLIAPEAPIFMSVASKCELQGHRMWYEDNPVAQAQQELVNDNRVFPGVNTDLLLSDVDRRDRCHLSEVGQLKVAAAYAGVLLNGRSLSRSPSPRT